MILAPAWDHWDGRAVTGRGRPQQRYHQLRQHSVDTSLLGRQWMTERASSTARQTVSVLCLTGPVGRLARATGGRRGALGLGRLRGRGLDKQRSRSSPPGRA